MAYKLPKQNFTAFELKTCIRGVTRSFESRVRRIFQPTLHWRVDGHPLGLSQTTKTSSSLALLVIDLIDARPVRMIGRVWDRFTTTDCLSSHPARL